MIYFRGECRGLFEGKYVIRLGIMKKLSESSLG
jgi:hypothetical protein